MHNGAALYASNAGKAANADDAAKLDGLAPEAYIQPQDNILDNGYFKINQQVKTEYTADGYSVDRWLIVSSSDSYSLKVHDGYIEFINNGKDTAAIWQLFEELLPGTYTIAVLTGNGLICKTVVWDGNTGVLVSTSFGKFFIGGTSGRIHMSIIVNPGITEKFYAAKLEHGPRFTGWPVWNYALELLRCQRYFYRTVLSQNGFLLGQGIAYNASSLSTKFYFPTSMREGALSAIKYQLGHEFKIWNTGNENIANTTHHVTDIRIDQFSENSVSLDFITTGLIPGTPYFWQTKGGYIEFNKNL